MLTKEFKARFSHSLSKTVETFFRMLYALFLVFILEFNKAVIEYFTGYNNEIATAAISITIFLVIMFILHFWRSG